jgi:hypothetical protein
MLVFPSRQTSHFKMLCYDSEFMISNTPLVIVL